MLICSEIINVWKRAEQKLARCQLRSQSLELLLTYNRRLQTCDSFR